MIFDLAPMQVRLNEDLGKLPRNISIEFPKRVGAALVRRGLATPVADTNLFPDLVLTVDDMEHTGIDWLQMFDCDDDNSTDRAQEAA